MNSGDGDGGSEEGCGDGYGGSEGVAMEIMEVGMGVTVMVMEIMEVGVGVTVEMVKVWGVMAMEMMVAVGVMK